MYITDDALPGSISSPRHFPESRAHALDTVKTAKSATSSSFAAAESVAFVLSNNQTLSRSDSKEQQREQRQRREEEKRLQTEALKEKKRLKKRKKELVLECYSEKCETYDIDRPSDMSGANSFIDPCSNQPRDDQASVSDRSICGHPVQLPRYNPIWGDVEIDIMPRMILLEWVRAAEKSHKNKVIVSFHNACN